MKGEKVIFGRYFKVLFNYDIYSVCWELKTMDCLLYMKTFKILFYFLLSKDIQWPLNILMKNVFKFYTMTAVFLSLNISIFFFWKMKFSSMLKMQLNRYKRNMLKLKKIYQCQYWVSIFNFYLLLFQYYKKKLKRNPAVW